MNNILSVKDFKIVSEYYFDEGVLKYFIHHKKYGILEVDYDDYFKVIQIIARHNLDTQPNTILIANKDAHKEIKKHIENILKNSRNK
jgi:hypothetical protein